ncbi:HAD family hydrolase [Polycladomyces sp. WAk]|uniref:HAD family hydrolase n=1 Tax=Polycladomyces zharkentensis TaxID=2807616 RepID=A0ABS2WGN9_9BACL|nr:HAD family hydrolase [Polycladomyces sp. WAk]MBN2908728.1 HAD family hydrolase [Polycladomyces sp. WAk]
MGRLNEVLLSFDLDHTLMINPFRRWVFPEINRWLQSHFSEENPVNRLIREHRRRLLNGACPKAYDWDDILRSVASGRSIPFTVRELVEKHTCVGKVWLFADVLPAMDRLAQAGARMVAATNGFTRYQRPVTDCLGLTPYFDRFHTPEEMQCAKPQAAFFHFGKGSRVIHVGDRLDQDVLGANRAHQISVWIYREMSLELIKLPVSERNRHPLLSACLAARLHREGVPTELHEACHPQYVIYTLDELPEIWEQESGSEGISDKW